MDRSTILADSGHVKSQSDASPGWLDKLSKRAQEQTKRSLGVLSILALDSPLSESQVASRGGARSSVLRSLKFLKDRGLVTYRLGEHGAKLFDITNLGLYFCFVQHYLTSKEFVKSIARRSGFISTLLGTGDASLEELIDETSILTWSMAYYESVQSTLRELPVYGESKSKIESAEDDHYFDILRGVGSVESLESALITRMVEQVKPRDLKKMTQRLGEKEKAELRSKLVEVRNNYVSSRSGMNEIIQSLNRSLRIFDTT